ncbi:zinc finger protein 62-like [Armigeres subalbatus]|uniref:zinc finger protein 62-like n=1 Tax=Armigeres subalbatus TaxID=124917 RepID=UPI002ED60C14
MHCLLCNDESSPVAVHPLCGSCLDRCKSTCIREETSKLIVPKKELIHEIECEACLGKFPEEDLAVHRVACSAQVVYRCALCNAQYLTKEGLWSHLDSHGIEDASRNTYCSEERISCKLHTCALCCDRRCYQETIYWEHVHEDHDGFFLKCSECEETFRSKKLLNDHILNHCKIKRTLELPDLLVKQEAIDLDLPVQVDDSTTSRKRKTRSATISDKLKAAPGTNDKMEVDEEPMVKIPLSESKSDTKCPFCSKELHHEGALDVHIKNSHKPTKCDKCDLVFAGRSRMSYHKVRSHPLPKFECPYCPEKFHAQATYQPHLKAHLNAECYPCHICERQCKDLRYLAQHYRRYHYPDAHFQNLFAALKARDQGDNEAMNAFKLRDVVVKEEIEVEDSELQPQETSEEGRAWTADRCPICDEHFDDRERVSMHVQEVHSVTICTLCGVIFDDADQLLDHKAICSLNSNEMEGMNSKAMESSDKSVTSSATEDVVKKLIKSEPTGSKCPHCHIDFKNTTILSGHIECCHEPIICDTCGITSCGTTEARDHKFKVHGEKLFKCFHCPKRLQSKSLFLAHMIKHLEDRKFTCETCGHKFKSLVTLISHVTKDHSFEDAWLRIHRRFKDCYVQQPELAAENGLSGEKLAILLDESLCEKSSEKQSPDQIDDEKLPNSIAENSSDSNPSKRKSSKSKSSFKCPHCDKTYSSKWKLNTHIDEQHRSSNPKSQSKTELKCPDCPKVYFANWRLNDHIYETHRKIDCDECGVSFNGWTRARYHKMKHHTEPKFPCPHCPERYHLKTHLARHVSKHVEEKNYPCEICGARFKDQQYVRMHIQRTHHLKGWTKGVSTAVEDSEKNTQSSQVEFVPIKEEVHES